MTMFRVGPAGIPGSLKTDMNAILNKKFGTSGQNYPPKQWPDDVNLMGALEEKTASSASICSFSDGADDVPMSSVIAHIAPNLTGTNAVNMKKEGKNFLDDTLANLAQGSINGSTGSNENANNRVRSINAIPFAYDKIASSYTWTIPTGYKVAIRPFDANGDFVSLPSWALGFITTLPQDLIGHGITQMKFVFARTDNADITPSDIAGIGFQIEVGSTASSYEPYSAPTDYTASLGRTVYGADADLVSGQGTETHKKASFNASNAENWKLVATGTYRYAFQSIDYIENNTMSTNFICDNIEVKNTSENVNDGITCRGTAYQSRRFYIFIPIQNDLGINDVATFKTWLNSNPCSIAYPPSTQTDFTFDGQEIPSLLGVNNLWHEDGDTEAVYRSSGTVTPVPIQPTLITKTITENGTYSAEDDNADGYSEVTVNVQGGETPFVPQFTETLIADNTSHASSFTLSEDYGNYDMVKIVWYESATVSGFLYTTPDILDEIFSVGVGKLCINKPSTNYYICYSKNGLTWTQTNQRVLFVHEIYGVTFTNCTMTATDLYKRGTSTTDKHAVTSQTSLKEYDLFMMSSIHATDGSETMPTTWLYQYPPENMSDAFSCPIPAVLQECNANDEAFVISEYGMTAARYFMVQGIKFTSVVGEYSDPNQVNELVENDEEVIPEQLNEVVENDETEQEGENDAR